MLTTERVGTMIVSSSGTMQQALSATLAALPWVNVIGTAGGGLSTVEFLHQQTVGLVVVDGSLPEDELLILIRHLKQSTPEVYCMVLAETSRQRRRVLSAGADAALLRSAASEDLRAGLEHIRVEVLERAQKRSAE